MPDLATWSRYFSGPYKVLVKEKLQHNAQLVVTPNQDDCLAVTLIPEGRVAGHASGFFHLRTRSCSNHKGDYNRDDALTGGWMELIYGTDSGTSGFTRTNLRETGFDQTNMILFFDGWVWVQGESTEIITARIEALMPRRHIAKYPWLP